MSFRWIDDIKNRLCDGKNYLLVLRKQQNKNKLKNETRKKFARNTC